MTINGIRFFKGNAEITLLITTESKEKSYVESAINDFYEDFKDDEEFFYPEGNTIIVSFGESTEDYFEDCVVDALIATITPSNDSTFKIIWDE